MAQQNTTKRPAQRSRSRRDWGKAFARILCFVFALIGAVPLSGGLLLRSAPLRTWAADETSRILRQELGVNANFSVELSLVPLRLAIRNLRVPSTDGPIPALEARLIAVSPRFFSLLAGRIDVGDIELEDIKVRLVAHEGQVTNVAYRLPDRTTESDDLRRSPFRSLAVTNARLDISIDGTQILTEGIDIDAFAEKNLGFDVALRAGGATSKSTRQIPQKGSPSLPALVGHDEDRLCALDLRVFLSREEIVLRRLSLLGALDLSPAPDTRPSCHDKMGIEKVALRLSRMKISPQSEGLPHGRGHLVARAPLALVDRWAPGIGGEGWLAFSGDFSMNGNTRLPEVTGRLTGAAMKLKLYNVADHFTADVLVTGDTIRLPRIEAGWGNGKGVITGLTLDPFAEKSPLSIKQVIAQRVDFPGIMQDVDVTDHSWVDWTVVNGKIENIQGTLSPFTLDGAYNLNTEDFVVWDRGFDHPARQRMIGIPQASLKGRFRAHAEALEFYQSSLAFGQSNLPIKLVSVPFGKGPLIVRTNETGGELNLKDVSPLADVDLAGSTQLYVDLEGPKLHPILRGTLKAQNLVIDGFPAGNIDSAVVRFEPLFVEFSEVSGNKGKMNFELPKARLSFDGPSSVEFTASVKSKNFIVDEFFDIFHFDEDPRFDGIHGQGNLRAQVRYLLGGPEDTCQGGRLMVEGNSQLEKTEFFGESYNGGNAEFDFQWFDMDAGVRGMRVNVPSFALRKGTGSLFGSIKMRPGGILSGDFVGTQIPLSRIDSLNGALSHANGFISGEGQLGGTAEALGFLANVELSALRAGDQELAPSNLSLRLIPEPTTAPKQGGPLTHCGRRIATDDSEPLSSNTSEGTYFLSGQLFDKQVLFDDVSITRQANMVVRGGTKINSLDVGALGSLFYAGGIGRGVPTGHLSGDLDLENFSLAEPFASRAQLHLIDAALKFNGLDIHIADAQAKVVIKDRKLRTENLVLRATTPRGQSGVLDVNVALDESSKIAASFALRPTSLDVLAAAMTGVERAEGKLSANFGINGALMNPQLSGAIQIEEGFVSLVGFKSPISSLNVNVELNQTGLKITEGNASWGGGQVRIGGLTPLSDLTLGRTDLTIEARQISLPVDDHTRLQFDADLNFSLPAPTDESLELPELTGDVNILSASYTKPMSITADINSLAARGGKTKVDSYDATKNSLKVDLLVHSSRPLRVDNDLVVSTLMIDPSGLRITGTDQRFGAVGSVEIESGGQIFLRRNEFEIRRGLVRFNDPTHLRPEVDLMATTEYRRYEDNGPAQGDGASAEASSGAPIAGNWRIHLHAYGPPEDLKVDLNSDPPLAQDDIFLLLTVGLTRTELDQAQSSGVGSSVALEALGSLSGAESAVKRTVPIDEFRFGSSYSSRSGRTEPTVTIGKRLSRRMRASVTTSLSDSSEVRSNIEYRATDNLSVEGSYDNAGDVASAVGGNLGGDVRWRLEFQ